MKKFFTILYLVFLFEFAISGGPDPNNPDPNNPDPNAGGGAGGDKGDESKESCGFSGYCGDGYCCKFASGCFCSAAPCRELCSNGFNGHKFVNLFLETEKKLMGLLKESGEKEVLENLQMKGIAEKMPINNSPSAPQTFSVDNNGIGNFNPKTMFAGQNVNYANYPQMPPNFNYPPPSNIMGNGYYPSSPGNFNPIQYNPYANQNNAANFNRPMMPNNPGITPNMPNMPLNSQQPNTAFVQGKVSYAAKGQISSKAKELFSQLHNKFGGKNNVNTKKPVNTNINGGYKPIASRGIYIGRKSKAYKKARLLKSMKIRHSERKKSKSQKSHFLHKFFKN